MPLRRFVPYGDPLKAGRHPFEIFILALCLASGIPLLAGQPPSGALEQLLPAWMSVLWGATLSVGAAVALLGVGWRGDLLTGLTLERIGLTAVGNAALVYAVIVVSYAGAAAGLAAAVTAGFGAACLWRAHGLGRLIRGGGQDS